MTGDPQPRQWLLHCSAWERWGRGRFWSRVSRGSCSFQEVPQAFPGVLPHVGLGADWEGENALGWVPGGAAKQGGCPGLAVGWGESPACGNRALLWCGAGGTRLAGVWAQRWVRAAPAPQGWGSWGAALSVFAPSPCISITGGPVTCPDTTMLYPPKSPAAGQQSGSVTSPGGRDARCRCRIVGQAGSTGDLCHSWHRKPGAGGVGEQLLPHIVGCRHLTCFFAGGGWQSRAEQICGRAGQPGGAAPSEAFWAESS